MLPACRTPFTWSLQMFFIRRRSLLERRRTPLRGDSGPDQAEEDKTEDDDAECLPFTELEDDEALTKINTLLNVYP